jgi:hypothetical protein
MKLALVLGFLAGGYYLFLTHTTDLVLTQVQNLRTTYSYVANNADHIASGR